MTVYVYMVLCSDDSIYVGITDDVARRYQQHVKGLGAQHTRNYSPKQLLQTWDCVDRSEAARLENYFKTLTRDRKLYAAEHKLRYGVPRLRRG